MVVTEGDPANPMTLLTKQHHRAAFTSSYDEEKVAMRVALEWLLPSHAATIICTDSQSFLKAIQSGSADSTPLNMYNVTTHGLSATLPYDSGLR